MPKTHPLTDPCDAHQRIPQALLRKALSRRLLGWLVVGSLLLGLVFGFMPSHIPALAESAALPGQVQTEDLATPPLRSGQRKIAQEVVENNFKDQFGHFNLFIIFFVTLGPLKVIPVFVQLTRNADRALKRRLALVSTVVSTLVVLLVVLLGSNLLRVWRIQLPALMIASGILLSLVALRLILTQYDPRGEQAPSPEHPEPHLAITPLAFPTILPPFGIAIALTLMIVSTELGLGSRSVVALLVVVMGLNLLSMLAAVPIIRFLRPVTLKILGFTLGVMQFALGIQFVLSAMEIQALVFQLLLKGQ